MIKRCMACVFWCNSFEILQIVWNWEQLLSTLWLTNELSRLAKMFRLAKNKFSSAPVEQKQHRWCFCSVFCRSLVICCWCVCNRGRWRRLTELLWRPRWFWWQPAALRRCCSGVTIFLFITANRLSVGFRSGDLCWPIELRDNVALQPDIGTCLAGEARVEVQKCAIPHTWLQKNADFGGGINKFTGWFQSTASFEATICGPSWQLWGGAWNTRPTLCTIRGVFSVMLADAGAYQLHTWPLVLTEGSLMKGERNRNASLLDTVFFFLFPRIWQDIWFIAQISKGQKLQKKKNVISAGFHFKGYTITYSKPKQKRCTPNGSVPCPHI